MVRLIWPTSDYLTFWPKIAKNGQILAKKVRYLGPSQIFTTRSMRFFAFTKCIIWKFGTFYLRLQSCICFGMCCACLESSWWCLFKFLSIWNWKIKDVITLSIAFLLTQIHSLLIVLCSHVDQYSLSFLLCPAMSCYSYLLFCVLKYYSCFFSSCLMKFLWPHIGYRRDL